MKERKPYKVVITRTVTTVESAERTVFAENEDDAKVLGRYEDVSYWKSCGSNEVIKVTHVLSEHEVSAAPTTYGELAQRVALEVAAGDARN